MLKNCHSDFVHYNQIMHDHYSNHYCHGGGCGSIFTTHHHCGGIGFGGGFWGGVGAGIGLGVSNLLMGGINMLGNWLFGGMGFGNFGMGFGNWGGGFGNFGFGNTGFWGLNGTNNTSEKNEKTSKKDIDNKKIADLTEKLNKLEAGKVTEDQYNELKAEIEQALKDTDSISKRDDTKTYKNLLKQLELYKPSGTPGAGTTGTGTSGTGTTTATVQTQTVLDKDAQRISDLADELADLHTRIKAGDTVTQKEIDDLSNKINAITEDSLDGIQDDTNKQDLASLKKLLPELTPTIKSNMAEILAKTEPSEDDIRSLIINFEHLTPEQKAELKTKAEDKVKDLKNDDGSYKPARNNYSQWLYLELLGKLDSSLVVNMETRSASSDTWIKGRPYNVQKDAKGNITYWIDCSKTGKEIKAAWKFETTDGNSATIIGTEATDETQKEYNATIGMEYQWNEVLGCYVNNNGKPTAR